MSEFKRITKEQTRLLKQLLNSASGDSCRQVLMCIHVDTEKKQMTSANGFILTFMQYGASGLEEVFPKSGIYNVVLGKIGKDNIVEVTEFVDSGTTYPNLDAVVHAKDLEPVITFGLTKSFLYQLLQMVDGIVAFRVWGEKQALELQYNVTGVPCYSAIMPVSLSNTSLSLWHPVEYVPPTPHIEKPV